MNSTLILAGLAFLLGLFTPLLLEAAKEDLREWWNKRKEAKE